VNLLHDEKLSNQKQINALTGKCIDLEKEFEKKLEHKVIIEKRKMKLDRCLKI